MDAPPILVVHARRFGPHDVYGLQDGVLVRATGRRNAQWPLDGLRRFTLGLRRTPYAKPVCVLRLDFKGHVETLVGDPHDEDYAVFVRALAAEAGRRAPHARFQAEGGRIGAALTLTAALLAAGAGALALIAAMAGMAPLGLDLAARLAFLLILIFALTPWIERLGPRPLDPDALPDSLLGPS